MRPTSHQFAENSAIYYNVFRGFGSNPGCTQNSLISICPGEMFSCFCSEFCWFWGNPATWRAVDHLPNVNSQMKIESKTLWLIAPYLVILSSLVSLLGTLFIILSYRIDQATRIALFRSSLQKLQFITGTGATGVLELESIFCLDPANAAIICFFLTSSLSHGFLIAVSLSDTQNPWIWQLFIQYFSPHSHFDSPPIEICFTNSGWVFATGTILSYLQWIGMLYIWVRFPSCLLVKTSCHRRHPLPPSVLPDSLHHSIEAVPSLISISPCTHHHTSPEREDFNPIVNSKMTTHHQRFYTV